MRALYGDRMTIGHIVVALRDKFFPDGTWERHKARIALADQADARAGQAAEF